VNIPREYLACRAISISPGGASRSGNQPFWNSPDPNQQIITDGEIEKALAVYKKRFPDTLNFVGNADEFRTRLNESSCSGCHQTRAIAGFHLPGADRPGESPVNSVFLPGSPHFLGDQLRRLTIVRLLAQGKKVSPRTLAASYAGRPQRQFTALKPSADPTVPRDRNIQLVGGWGGMCLTHPLPHGIRDWGCASGLECRPVFDSVSQPNAGICVSKGRTEVGEAMQYGSVTSLVFGLDRYRRSPPVPVGPPRDTTIDVSALTPPADNSYFAAHQEYFEGDGDVHRRPGETDEQWARRVRDQGTGGFPAGSLRLSECVNLPPEATCALLASGGFNGCLDEVKEGKRTPDSCFRIYTSFAGVRACDPANPCRDDYICMGPAGLTAANAAARLHQRQQDRDHEAHDNRVSQFLRDQLALHYFGERIPDEAFLNRNGGLGDRRGVCIPPYFIFQFKADGHRVPSH
jgi:hypothetical protein